MKDTLVAINIIDELNGTLVNNQKYPILYYWNGEDHDGLFESLRHDSNFKKYVLKGVSDYFTSRMYFFYFDNRDGDERYTEQNKTIQEYVSYDDLSDEHHRVLIHKYVFPAFDKLYNDVFKTSYPNCNVDNIYDIVKSIYVKIKNKYGDRVSVNTVVNYVRSQMMNEKFYEYVNEDTRKSLFKHITEIIDEG